MGVRYEYKLVSPSSILRPVLGIRCQNRPGPLAVHDVQVQVDQDSLGGNQQPNERSGDKMHEIIVHAENGEEHAIEDVD